MDEIEIAKLAAGAGHGAIEKTAAGLGCVAQPATGDDLRIRELQRRRARLWNGLTVAAIAARPVSAADELMAEEICQIEVQLRGFRDGAPVPLWVVSERLA